MNIKKILISISWITTSLFSYAQDVSQKLKLAFEQFEKDTQMKSAIGSLYVINSKTGDVVFEKNAMTGLAPASTQKIIIATAAYELLGKTFSYETNIGYSGKINNGRLTGNIYIQGSGDPTFGSWRWKQTSENAILEDIAKALKKAGINTFNSLAIANKGWEDENIPDGWIWQDLGNYYGAPAEGINWRENQYDLYLSSGKNIGDSVKIIGTKPHLYNTNFVSHLTAGPKESGDNSNIYLPLHSSAGIITGSIPVSESRFTVSGAMPFVKEQFSYTLLHYLQENGIRNNLSFTSGNLPESSKKSNSGITTVFTIQSPPLDSIIYWFLKKSINLYGEALIKTIAFKNGSSATTDNGVQILKKWCSAQGIPSEELNIIDGSGLSPANRVTTHAEVNILKYASLQPWFEGFYYALPEYNGMKMKSGTIGGVKGFCGYHTSKDGHQYIFSFLVNNYNGSTFSLVRKMYHVLDELK